MNREYLTTILERDGDQYVAVCVELHFASQGETEDRARSNLEEAVSLWFETAPPDEVARRLKGSRATSPHPRTPPR